MGETKPSASLSSGLLARKGGARPAMRRPNMPGGGGAPAVGQDDLGWNDMGYDVNPAPDTPMDHEHDNAVNPLAGAVLEVKPEVKIQQERIAKQLQAQPETEYPKESIEDSAKTTSLPVGGVWAAEEEETAEETGPADTTILSKKPARKQDALASAAASAVKAEPAVNEQPLVEEQPAAKQQPVVTEKPAPAAAAAIVSKPAPAVASVAKPKKRAAPGSKGKAAFTLRLDKERHLKLRLACAVSNKSAQNLVTEALDALLDDMPEVGQLAANVPNVK